MTEWLTASGKTTAVAKQPMLSNPQVTGIMALTSRYYCAIMMNEARWTAIGVEIQTMGGNVNSMKRWEPMGSRDMLEKQPWYLHLPIYLLCWGLSPFLFPMASRWRYAMAVRPTMDTSGSACKTRAAQSFLSVSQADLYCTNITTSTSWQLWWRWVNPVETEGVRMTVCATLRHDMMN